MAGTLKGNNFELAPAQWTALRDLLDIALDLPAAARAHWLEQLGPEHAELAPRLRALLAHADSPIAESMLNTLPKVETHQFAPTPEGAQGGAGAGARVGPYRLLKLLGEGGMAAVWLAERTDLLQSRKIALKLPHGAWRRAGLAERMAREREILATLEHPNIARLYDAGMADDGQPYLALEYVSGIRIDEYCRSRGLGISQRLRLFIQASQAVACAHARLVVHRDLKPSNILVTDAGEVKLLDFGIAKLLDQGIAGETALTEQTGRALTPDYAAPEQVLGQPMGTAADVYALGVVLFELLCDTRPYALKRDTRAALEEAVLQADVPRPSSVAAQERRRALRGDLDTIVLKALKKEPTQRYATVESFASDIERHLRDEPVLARPDTRVYRMRKFITRNTLATSAAGAVLLAIVVGAGLATWQSRVAIAERNRAQEVRTFIESIFRDADPYGEGQGPMTVVTLLNRAHARVDRDLLARPEMRVEMLDLIGNGLKNLQETKAALSTLDDAVAAAQSNFGAGHPLTLQVRVSRLEAYRYNGKSDEMQSELQQLLPLLHAKNASPADLVVALQMQAHTAIDAGRYDQAKAAASEALETALRRLGEADMQAANAATVLALAHEYSGEAGPAKAAAQRAIDLTLKASRGDLHHPAVIGARTALARATGELGELRPCIDLFEQVIRESIDRLGPDAIEVGFNTHGMVKYLLEAGEIRRAQQVATQAAKVFKLHASPDTHFYPLARASHAGTLLAARRADLAVGEIKPALAQITSVMGAAHPYVHRTREALALAQLYLGQTAAAGETLRASTSGAPSWRGLLVQSMVARELGDAPAAVRLAQQALAATAGPRAPIMRMQVLPGLGLALANTGQFPEAEAAAREAITLMGRIQLVESPDHADASLVLGRARLGLGHPGEAMAPMQAAERFWTEFEPTTPWAGEATYWLARTQEAMGDSVLAKSSYARAAANLARSPIASHVALASVARRAASSGVTPR